MPPQPHEPLSRGDAAGEGGWEPIYYNPRNRRALAWEHYGHALEAIQREQWETACRLLEDGLLADDAG